MSSVHIDGDGLAERSLGRARSWDAGIGWIGLLLVVGSSAACAGREASPPAEPPVVEPVSADAPLAVVELGNVVQHFHTIPVRVGGASTTAILDTGIGLALISKPLCERLGCEISGEFTGQRMSGQAVTLPLTTVASLEIGGVSRSDVIAGVVDIEGFFPHPDVEAFVGLPFFETIAVTIDPTDGVLVLESTGSLPAREQVGQELPIRLQRHDAPKPAFVAVALGDGAVKAEVLMDTGSPGVTLHPRYAEALELDLESETVTRREGTDETGHTYVRHFVDLPASLAFANSALDGRVGLRTMFQEIIYDGLVGVEFMSAYAITFDLANERIIVHQPAAASAARRVPAFDRPLRASGGPTGGGRLR